MKTFSSITTRTFSGLILALFLIGSITPAAARQLNDTPPPPDLPQAASTLYMPIISRPGNIFLGAMEITQAVQTSSNAVPLVAGRQTVARVYARTTSTSSISGVSATLRAYRGGSLLGQLTLNNGTAFPNSVSLDTLRGSASNSFNFQLQSAWVSTPGAVDLQVTFSGAGLAPDEPQSPDFVTQTFNFNYVPALNIVAVPIRLDGAYGPASTTYLQTAVKRMFPVPSVNVSIHSTYDYDDSDGNWTGGYTDWSDLLSQITGLRNSDSPSPPASTVYYGVVPLRDASGHTWFPINGGIVGIGWVGSRSAIGVSTETFSFPGYPGLYALGGDDTAAHEIGHNLGRYHSPNPSSCGQPSNVDPAYPYANGIIGQFGFKVNELPSQTVVSKNAYDIMNYCDNQWVSDYTYQGLYYDQVQALNAVAQPEQDSLYIRARIDENGIVEIEPVYEFLSSPETPAESSEYVVQFSDETGSVVAEYPVAVMYAEENGYEIRSIHSRVPRPDKPFSAFRIARNGLEVARREVNNQSAAATTAPTLVRDGDTLTLQWGAAGLPALVRYSTDNGQSWSTLAVDAKDGRLSLLLADLPGGSLQFQVILPDGGETYLLDWNP